MGSIGGEIEAAASIEDSARSHRFSQGCFSASPDSALRTGKDLVGVDELLGSCDDALEHPDYSSPNTRLKIVSTAFKWYPTSKFAASSASDRYFRTSGSALSNARKSQPSCHPFMALRWTMR
jgi:hypothetical protein